MSIQEQIQKLREALASNVTEVTIGTQTVKYRSIAELKEALRYLEELLAKQEHGFIGHTVQAVAGRRFMEWQGN